MSQQPTIVNGPSTEYNTSLKDEIINKDALSIQQNGNEPQPQPPQSPQSPQPPQPPQPGAPVRPLTRVDSRSSFQFRPPFPNQAGAPVRPGQVRQPPPPNTQQYIQRNQVPVPAQRPPVAQGPPGQQFPQNQQPRANFRPVTPFPRAPVQVQRPPGIFQQRSVPSYQVQRPQLPEEGFPRSQTLDTTEIEYSKPADDNKNTTNDHVKAPSIAAMNNRSYSLSSNPPEQTNESKEDARRRSISSVDSLGEGRPGSRHGSISGSTENLDKRQEVEVPSRPESRAMSRMNKIVEDEDRPPSSLADALQKSPELNISDRSQPVVDSNRPVSGKPPSPKPQSQSPQYQTPRPQAQSPLSPRSQTKPPFNNYQSPKPHKTAENVPGKMEGPSKTDKVLYLDKPPKPKSPVKTEGDNDSGVDESTQGNDQSSNSDNRSPRKSNKSRTSTTPTNARSLSRGSKSPSLKSPDSNATTPGSATERKKVPMNKIQVGSAPSPNLKVVKSKIGSLENTSYKPGGGKVKIESKKLDFKAAAPRIEAKNDKYMPKGGEKKIVQQKLQWNAKSKVGSLENATYKPKGGEKKIESVKLDFKGKAKPKVGSKDNIKYQPGGGDVKSEDLEEEKVIGNETNKNVSIAKEIETKKIDLKVTSKIGSLDNVKHKPGGGDKKIFDDKDYLKQKSAISSMDHSLSGSQNSLPSQPDSKVPVADENLNQEH